MTACVACDKCDTILSAHIIHSYGQFPLASLLQNRWDFFQFAHQLPIDLLSCTVDTAHTAHQQKHSSRVVKGFLCFLCLPDCSSLDFISCPLVSLATPDEGNIALCVEWIVIPDSVDSVQILLSPNSISVGFPSLLISALMLLITEDILLCFYIQSSTRNDPCWRWELPK